MTRRLRLNKTLQRVKGSKK